MKIFSKNNIKNPVLKSLNFKKNHPSIKSLFSEIDSIQLKLEKIGYLNSRLYFISKKDSIYTAQYFLGKSFKRIKIFYNKTSLTKKDVFRFTKNIEDECFEINLDQVPNTLNKIISFFENKGQSFTEVSLSQIKIKDSYLTSNLIIKPSEKRNIDKVVIRGYEKFPKTFLKHYLNLRNKSTFSSNKINELSRKIKPLNFASETKPAEVLFTNDSTYLYLNLKKNQANRFDGLIGFSSKENSNQLNLNGYLDLELNNILNSGEQISLNWKNNGKERQFFDLGIELPYIFNWPVTPKFGLNIYKQDSTFINTKTSLELGHLINYRNKISIIYNSENSNNLLEKAVSDVVDYKSKQFGLSYNFKILNDLELFPEKFNLLIKASTGSRKSEDKKNNQSRVNLETSYLWSLNFRNHIFLKNTSAILFSGNYLNNELFRIGGVNSIRGFNEESIFTNRFSVFNIEYRYTTNNTSYFYTISDFGITNNEISKNTNHIYSIGFGYSFKTAIGVIDFSYALGKPKNTTFKVSNSKFHIIINNFF